MIDYYFLFLVILALLAVLIQADFVLTMIYLLIGVFLVGQWWTRRALDSVSIQREYPRRAFFGEKIPVRLELRNKSWLPLVWLQIHESLPVDLVVPGFFRQVVSLGGKGRVHFDFVLEGRKRGFYNIGPLALTSGDLLGIAGNHHRRQPADYLVVYPKIVPLSRVRLPSRSPMGTLRHTQPVFEDPSRIRGKRDYVSGDSLRQVDWKASASAGRLQVKLFEPSIALETAIFLNLNTNEYDHRSRIHATELGIIVAASLANWIISQRQAVGFATNGIDPLLTETSTPQMPKPILPRRGRGHLMRILDVLARLQTGDTEPLVQLLQREVTRLPWGTTLILITSFMDEVLYDGLFQARRAGMNVVLLPCGPVVNFSEARKRAAYFGFPLHQILTEKDLDIWRQ